jgi:Family of unknown function (DUF5681)
MADDQHDNKVDPGHPRLHTRFRKGQSGNPDGRSKKKLHALLADALSEPVFVTIDGERRKITSARRSSISWSTNLLPPLMAWIRTKLRDEQ